MKQTLTYILICALLCSIALNVFQATKKPESLDAGTVAPTTDAPTTTAPSEEGLTLVELKALSTSVNHIISYFRRDRMFGPTEGYIVKLNEKSFMTKDSYQKVADLVNSLNGASVDTENRLIEVRIIDITDEKIATFLMLFGNDEYFIFSNDIGQSGRPGVSTMNTHPTE